MRKYSECLLDPSQVVLAIIDHQPMMYFGIEGISRGSVENNATALAKAAKLFKVPCILTTVEAATFSGPLAEKIQSVYPQLMPIDRTVINAWEDENFKKAVVGTGKKTILLAGLWTEVCVAFPALSMMQDGYKVYVVADACAGVKREVHNTAMDRMTQAGAVPVTSQQVMLEWQRDWNDKTTYNGLMAIIKEHGAAYGLGAEYVDSMVANSIN
jgi:nicotinamidase-related amidase